VLFQPEIERIVVGSTVKENGKIVQKYVNAKALLKDVAFEEAHGTRSLTPAPSPTGEGSENTGGNTGGSNGSGTGSITPSGGGDNNGGGGFESEGD
jgi:hypothetical protein